MSTSPSGDKRGRQLRPASKASDSQRPGPSGRSRRQPGRGSQSATVPRHGSADDPLAAFEGRIPPVRSSLGYRLGILLVALVMLLLPLIYLGLIGLVAWAVHYHAVHHTGLLELGRGRGKVMVALVYLAPMVVGPILVLFMFKPLLSRPAVRHRRRWLSRREQPRLFGFVERVCEAVGAPRPRRIDVDCQVNASASFRRGLLSFFGRDLVLTIGLPLAAGLSTRQFAGVLAHEFGHFAQGAGMRLTYVIRSISHWFTRVVYERDEWDQKLIDWSQAIDFRLGWILYLARAFVWLTRKILWVLMMIGHLVSTYMLRQMEFDADRHQARLAGSDAFESTMRRVVELGIAMQGAYSDLGTFYREGRLADNVPRLVLSNVSQFSPELRQSIAAHIESSKTGALDTHPSDRERIASARRENAPGVFRVEQPASTLFANFRELSKQVTLDYYHEVFGRKIPSSDLHSTDDLLVKQEAEQEGFKSLQRYFQNGFTNLRRLALPGWDLQPPQNAGEAVARVKDARRRMLEALPAYQPAQRAFDAADTVLLQAAQARALLKAKLRVPREAFPQPLTTSAQADEARQSARALQESLSASLDTFETAAGERLRTALSLLAVPALSERLDSGGQRRSECERLLRVLSVVNGQVPGSLNLRNRLAALAALFSRIEGNEEHQPLLTAIRQQGRSVFDKLREVHGPLCDVTYPFEHARGELSVARYAITELPDPDNLGEVYEAANSVVDTVSSLNARLVARLCVVAEQIESSLGLPKLPEPDANASGDENAPRGNAHGSRIGD